MLLSNPKRQAIATPSLRLDSVKCSSDSSITLLPLILESRHLRGLQVIESEDSLPAFSSLVISSTINSTSCAQRIVIVTQVLHITVEAIEAAVEAVVGARGVVVQLET